MKSACGYEAKHIDVDFGGLFNLHSIASSLFYR